MDMTGERRIAASRTEVWAALNDAEILRQCIPCCEEIDKSSDTEFSAKVTAKVGPVKARFGGKVESAAHADIVEVRVEKALRCLPPCGVKRAEELKVGFVFGVRLIHLFAVIERDAVGIDAAILAGAGTARQTPLIDEPGDKFDGAVFGQER